VQGDVLFEAAVEFFRRVQEVRQGLLPEAELDQLAPHEQVPAQQSDIAKKADTRIAWSAVREVGFPALAGAVAGLAVVHGGAGRAAFYVRGIRTRLRERHAGDRRGADADPELEPQRCHSLPPPGPSRRLAFFARHRYKAAMSGLRALQ